MIKIVRWTGKVGKNNNQTWTWSCLCSFSTLAHDTLSQITPVWAGGLSMYCRIVTRIPGLFPLDANRLTSIVKIKNVSRHWQMSPEGKIAPPLTTPTLRITTLDPTTKLKEIQRTEEQKCNLKNLLCGKFCRSTDFYSHE